MIILNNKKNKVSTGETEEQKVEYMKKLRALVKEKVQKDY